MNTVKVFITNALKLSGDWRSATEKQELIFSNDCFENGHKAIVDN